MNWSPYQQAIFSSVRETNDHLTIIARAGSGKTTVLVEALGHISGRPLLCAFNKSIERELSGRAPSHAKVKTLHGLGLWGNRMNLGDGVRVEPDKGREIVEKLLRDPRYKKLTDLPLEDGSVREGGNLYEASRRVRTVVSYAKSTCAASLSTLRHLAIALDQADGQFPADLLASAAKQAMVEAIEDPSTLDFDDMLWIPYQLDYPKMPRFDVVLVDESQDLNAVQIWMIRRILKPGGRMIAVGDDRQAIYQWRGADRQAIDRLMSTFEGRTLSLPVTYRCPKSVVRMVNEIVPDFEARPDAPEGEVTSVDYDDAIKLLEPGDFFLSRLNAPLIKACIAVLRRQIPATIMGRELGRRLEAMIKKSQAETIRELREWLTVFLREESEFKAESPERYERAVDLVDCVHALCIGANQIHEVKAKIGRLFDDRGATNVVTFATVHKAKGLERNRVFCLKSSFGYFKQQNPNPNGAEANLWYVAATRARDHLFIVLGGGD